jgi:hypothetical protein
MTLRICSQVTAEGKTLCVLPFYFGIFVFGLRFAYKTDVVGL